MRASGNVRDVVHVGWSHCQSYWNGVFSSAGSCGAGRHFIVHGLWLTLVNALKKMGSVVRSFSCVSNSRIHYHSISRFFFFFFLLLPISRLCASGCGGAPKSRQCQPAGRRISISSISEEACAPRLHHSDSFFCLGGVQKREEPLASDSATDADSLDFTASIDALTRAIAALEKGVPGSNFQDGTHEFEQGLGTVIAPCCYRPCRW